MSFIECNISQIEDVIIYSELNHTSEINLTVDLEKAFDSIEANIHCLGIVLSGNEDDNYELIMDYKKRISYLGNVLNIWKRRKLFLTGHIHVIK